MILDKLNKQLIETVQKVADQKSVSIDKKLLNQINFEISDEESHGDYSTSCALKLSKAFNMQPREIAKLLTEGLSLPFIESTSVEGAGFINVFLTREEKIQVLKEVVIQDSKWGKNTKKQGNVLIEFVSSNPTGPLHVGHGRGAVLGMALSNLLENSGYEVTKEYYVNDAGRQISILTSSILIKAHINNFDVIINATSLGLNNESINLDFSKLANNKLFYDVIYNPEETNFLKEGKKLGNRTENGKLMFVYQAFEAFKLWHGIEPQINSDTLEILKND